MAMIRLAIAIATTIALIACGDDGAPDGGGSVDAAVRGDATVDAAVADAMPDATPPRECARAEDCADYPVAVCRVPDCGTDGLCTGVAAPDGIACSDGDGCTTGESCSAGECAGGTIRACDDGLDCTTDDACRSTGTDSWTCAGTPATGRCAIDGACVPAGTTSGPCLVCDPTADTNAWTALADGTPCDADSDGCTVNDSCSAGACAAGPAAPCEDALACTTDSCISTAADGYRCESVPDGTSCVIDAACVPAGATVAGNVCLACDPAMDPSGWSPSSASCNDGDACTTSDRCMGGACSGTPRVDFHESNDTPARATRLPTSWSSSTSLRWIEGGSSIYPAGDEDWFMYDVNVDSGALRPGAELRPTPGASPREVCITATCGSYVASSFTCARGRRTSFGGRQGCCDTTLALTGHVTIVPDCSSTPGTLRSSRVLVRVGVAPGFTPTYMCTNYTLTHGDE